MQATSPHQPRFASPRQPPRPATRLVPHLCSPAPTSPLAHPHTSARPPPHPNPALSPRLRGTLRRCASGPRTAGRNWRSARRGSLCCAATLSRTSPPREDRWRRSARHCRLIERAERPAAPCGRRVGQLEWVNGSGCAPQTSREGRRWPRIRLASLWRVACEGRRSVRNLARRSSHFAALGRR